ncbi:hypothetical protein PSTT_02879 [Puccinia striiformis]|uniref:MsrB domain-containing protein n=1 Tax=Puccinia striiformis TaxID=27350 RepID=A0A2S4VXZ5_9BASI|nr:hypothetical protein PSTT_02879 [Puccinia striiformis]
MIALDFTAQINKSILDDDLIKASQTARQHHPQATSDTKINLQRSSLLELSIVRSRAQNRQPNRMSNLPKTEEEWRLKLDPEQFRILRKKGTEMAGTGEYNKHLPSHGVYECAGCAAPLSFFDGFPGAISRHEDRSFGRVRTEITCTNCGGHLGHVFKGEGYGHPTDERHCVNSISIKFNESMPAEDKLNPKH